MLLVRSGQPRCQEEVRIQVGVVESPHDRLALGVFPDQQDGSAGVNQDLDHNELACLCWPDRRGHAAGQYICRLFNPGVDIDKLQVVCAD